MPEWAHLGDNGNIVLAGRMAFTGYAPVTLAEPGTGLPEWAHLGDNGNIVLAGRMAFTGYAPVTLAAPDA